MKTYFAEAGILLGLCAVSFAQSQPQSLAEVAKQKKPAKKAVLVLSDENLPPSAPADDADDQSGPAVSTSSDSEQKTESGKPEESKDQDKKKETEAPVSKDQRINELKEKLATYQKEEDGWKNSAKHNEELLENETSDFRRQTYLDAIENDKHNIALYQHKVDEIQNELNKQKSSQSSGNGSGTKPDGGNQP